jgi:two-component system response regulator YesN
MLKMIIADDEYIVRDGLRTIIPWTQYGIEVIAEAIDGQEALDLCLELKPDILFTDIRMPIMDGLEVAMELKEQGKDIKIIIISGVQDFNYAKTALNINAEGYILKPVKIPELEETVSKVVNGINLEKKKKLELQNLQQQLHKNLPVIREKFIRNLITGIYRQEQEITGNLEYLHIPLCPDESITVAVLQIDEYLKISRDISENDKQLLFYSISNIMDGIMNNYNAGVCSCINDNEFIAVFKQKIIQNGMHIDICNEFMTCINKFLNIDVSIGVGRTINNILHANASYKDAVAALQYSFYTGKNSLLNINDINNLNGEGMDRKDILYPSLYDQDNLIINSMKLGNTKDVERNIDELFMRINSSKNLPADYVQNICIEMIYSAARAIYELKENMDQIVSSRQELIDTIYKTKNIFDIQSTLKTAFVAIASYFSRKYTQKNNKIIAKIKEIIEQRYIESISMITISDEVYLSPNYISLIFKQETGETITEYITKVRMEKAKQLLTSCDLKILEVAEKVGFENAHYFSTVFKKYTGIHPQKYRTNAAGKM